jgi:hypothetical protein
MDNGSSLSSMGGMAALLQANQKDSSKSQHNPINSLDIKELIANSIIKSSSMIDEKLHDHCLEFIASTMDQRLDVVILF